MLVTDMAQGIPKTTKAQRREIAAAYEAFVDANEDPHAASFVVTDPVARKYWVTKDNVYDWGELALITQRALAKQESYWRDKGKNGQATAMSIFVLKQKQIGYQDRVDQNVTSNGERVTFVNTLPRGAKVEVKKLPGRAKKS